MAKPKYSSELKISIVRAYLEGSVSQWDLAARYRVGRQTVYSWIKKYQAQGEAGFIQHSGNAQYSKGFKLMCVEAVLRGEGSVDDIVAKYNISSRSVLIKWVQRYNANKELKDYDPKREVYMADARRKTTLEERKEIVQYCLEHNKDYKGTASKYGCSYAQVYQWVRNYEADGIDGLADNRGKRKKEEELTDLEKIGISFSAWNSASYPPLLKECADAPVGLYIRSVTPARELWNPSGNIAVVGTRDLSPYGKEWCEKAVTAIASGNEKPSIISGLALGTDICAHRTALDNGLPTIGVMATGPETVYPYRHKEFAERLWQTPGCALVTDYPPGTAPLAIHFLRRNRIIAGLADATILIESKSRGGGMTTSRLAFSYSRDVYALPGRADDVRSQGCNRLIREKIAEPLISIEDLIGSLGLEKRSGNRKISPVPKQQSFHIFHFSPTKRFFTKFKLYHTFNK